MRRERGSSGFRGGWLLHEVTSSPQCSVWLPGPPVLAEKWSQGRDSSTQAGCAVHRWAPRMGTGWD